jgi:hypothetical protein
MTVDVKRLLLAMSLALPCSSPAPAEMGQLAKAGLQSPAIAAIRRVYRSVEHDIATGRMKPEQRSIDDCSPLGEQRTIYSDTAGTVRKYVVEAGSEDSALIIRIYYDSHRRKRFAFITGGNVNGSLLEHRVYLDESGARIREDHTYTRGPGYTFPSIWPAEDLAADPRRAYRRTTCSTIGSP